MSDASPDVVTQDASAPAPAPAAPPPDATTTPAADAQSASATKDEGKQTLLEAVLEALPEDQRKLDGDQVVLPGVTSDADRAKADQIKADESKPLDREITREELAAYPERTRSRIQQLLAEREALRPDAEVAVGLRNYLRSAQIDREGFEVLLDLGKAMRQGDFKTFYEGVRPYVDLAEQALGLRVAPDLARDVQAGHMTSEAAARMTSERMHRQLAEGRAQDLETGRRQEVVQTQTAEMRRALASAVNGWETETAKTDPDFALKQRMAKDVVWSVLREKGMPRSPDQAVEVAKEAYKRAEGHLRATQPAPRPTSPVPSSAHRTNGAMAAPKTLMEAALQGLQRSRA